MQLRPSSISADWWDYTCLPTDLVDEVARLKPRDIEKLSRPGFRVVMYDTLEDFYLAEALEYITAWKQSTADNPVGICGPIGPTEQLPLVARLVNELGIDVRSGHFWGMDEWFDPATGRGSTRNCVHQTRTCISPRPTPRRIANRGTAARVAP